MIYFDVVVFGSGPGGAATALRTAELGKSVAIVEQDAAGGTALTMGADPSKALLRNAQVAYLLRREGEKYGFACENLRLDYASAVRRSRKVAESLSLQMRERLEAAGVVFYEGHARMVNCDVIRVQGKDGSETELNAAHVVIATGMTPEKVTGIPYDGKQVITYREAILQETLPASALIIGGGALGVEFATLWNSYGVDVTIVEMMPHLAPCEEEEISIALEQALTARGIHLLLRSKVAGFEKENERMRVWISGPGEQKIISVEQVMESARFSFNSSGMGLEDLGVRIDKSGMIETDERMSSSVPGIWAVGDVNGKLTLAAAAAAMGNICAENIAGINTPELNFEMMPKITYCQPMIASLGLSESLACQRGHAVKVGRANFAENGRALALGNADGWVKVVLNADTDEILGVHAIGEYVDEMLQEVSLLQMMERPAFEITRNIHAHPTLGEALVRAVAAAGSL